MPGLVGIISPIAGNENRKDLLEMVGTMHQEPFYSVGTYINEKIGLYVGWTCIRGSYSDCMPITNETKDVILFFNGEHHSSKDELDRNPSGGRSHNAIIVLRMYQEKGYDFLKYLNGWFHGIVVDLKKQEIALFNDRYGMQRLNYHENADSLVFASEAKAILKVRSELRVLEPQSVGEFFICDCVLQNRTLFRNIVKLPGGSVWTYRNAKLQSKDFYFKTEDWESQPLLATEDLSQNLEKLFPQVVERYVEPPGLPVGVSLSGGIDTRQLMAYIDNRRFAIPCYTFSGMYRESFDVKLARRVAIACGQRHEPLELGRDFLSSFPALTEKTVYLADGSFPATGAYELYLNKLAREIAGIRLTGNYGSEVFRGVRGVKASLPNENLYDKDLYNNLHCARKTFQEESKCHQLTFSLFKQAPWLGSGRLSIEQSQVVPRTPFMDNDLVKLMYRAPDSIHSSTDIQWRLIERGNRDLINIPTDRGLHGRSGAISARLAYLMSYPAFKADYCYKSGMPQWMEKIHYLFGPMQPEKLLIGRHRFTHYRIWFRKELAPYIKDMLLDSKTLQRPYWNKSFIEPMVLRHIKGDRNYTNEIDQVLTMELIHRLFIDA